MGARNGTSIRRGVEALQHCDAIAILACDQAHVDQDVIKNLIRAHEETGKPIAASAYAATWGVPALFTGVYVEKLLSLDDRAGAKLIVLAQPNDVAEVAFPRGEIDIDTADNCRGL